MIKLLLDREKLFCYTFFIWCLYFSLFITTNYANKLEGNLQYIVVSWTIFVLVVKELASLREIMTYSLIRFSIMCIFLLLSIKVMGHSYGLIFLSSMLLVVSARDVNFSKILLTFILAVLTLFGLTIGGNKVGIVKSLYSIQDGRFRDSLGFSYVSFPSQYAFFLTAAYIALRKREISYLELVLLTGLDIYIYQNSHTISPFVLAMFLIIYVTITKILKTDIIVKFSLTRVLATLTFLIAPTILWWLCFKAPTALFVMADKFVNNRLRLSVSGLQTFGVTLFGQKVNFITLDSVGRFSSNYNYIDSSYFQNLVVNGLLFTVMILVLFTYVSYKSVRYQNDTLTVVLIALSLHAMFDPQMIVLWYSPFGMLLGKLFSGDDTDFIVKNQMTKL